MAKIVQKRRRHTTIANDFLQNKDISLQAKGLLALLFTYPEGWNFNESHLITQSTNGKTSFQSAMKELTKNGFVYRERNRNEKGRLSDITYYISDEPIFK